MSLDMLGLLLASTQAHGDGTGELLCLAGMLSTTLSSTKVCLPTDGQEAVRDSG